MEEIGYGYLAWYLIVDYRKNPGAFRLLFLLWENVYKDGNTIRISDVRIKEWKEDIEYLCARQYLSIKDGSIVPRESVREILTKIPKLESYLEEICRIQEL